MMIQVEVVPWKKINKIIDPTRFSRSCFTNTRASSVQKRFYVKELNWCKPRDGKRNRLSQLPAVDTGSVSSIYYAISYLPLYLQLKPGIKCKLKSNQHFFVFVYALAHSISNNRSSFVHNKSSVLLRPYRKTM